MNKKRHLEKLIENIALGNTDSFSLLYEETKSAVYGHALSIVKRPQDAEDIMQETYIRVFKNSHSYSPLGKPMAWILRITKNLSLDRLRSKNMEELPLEEDWISPNHDSP